MKIAITNNGNTLTAALDGRLDSVASIQMEKDIQPLIENADKHIVIDCKSLTYISSSGLRLLLTLRKKTIAEGGSVAIVNLSSEMRQIFTITGFVNLFDIE